MPKYHSITISFKPDAKNVYEFLKKKGNKSAYILQLIEKDMENQDNTTLNQRIKAIILEVLSENDISLNDFKKDSTTDTLTSDDISIINEYF